MVATATDCDAAGRTCDRLDGRAGGGSRCVDEDYPMDSICS